MFCSNCEIRERCEEESIGKRGEENNLPKISSAFLILTQTCNLRCKYCFVVQKPRSITLQTAIDASEFLMKNAKGQNEIPSINFFGGEPLLKWDDIIVPLTLHIRRKYGINYQLSMTTNGVLLDEPKLKFMKEHNIGFMVSIDGNKKTQDLNRPCANGSSSFDIIAPKIPLFLKYNPNMTFRATVDHDNASEYLNNHRFAVESGYTNMFSIVNVFSKWSEDEKKELEKQVEMVADYYMELLYGERNIIFNPFNTMFSKIEKIKSAKENNEFRTIGRKFLGYGKCGLGASRFASIGTDGTIYSCQEMSDNDDVGKYFVIGDIYNGTDDEKRMTLLNKFNPRKVHSTDVNCRECPLYMICDGACPINNYFVNRDLNEMPSILCFYYQCLFKAASRIQESIKHIERIVNNAKKRSVLNEK